MHLFTLSFDDGFRKSCIRIAEIYEKYGHSACFNVVATGHLETFTAPDKGQAGFRKGDFALWNELQARGHEIMPHGYRHANKTQVPLEEAKRLISDCLDIFARELNGFNAREAVFNFPYNQSTPGLEAWLPSVVRAFRTSGGGLNPLPHKGQVKLTTTGHGPENCEQHLDAEIEKWLASSGGWLIYNTHGLDDEGWGPIGADYLDRLLGRLLAVKSVRILPAGAALRTAGPATSC